MSAVPRPAAAAPAPAAAPTPARAAASGWRPPAALQRGLAAGAAGCGAVAVAGLLAAPERTWAGMLIGLVYLAGLGVSGLVFLAALQLADAGWAAALRRIPEAMSRSLPWAFGMGLALLAGIPALYEWSHEALVARDEVLRHKSGWLDPAAFALRLLLCFGLWLGFARAFQRRAAAEDRGGAEAATRRRGLILSSLFLLAFALSWSVASFDWLMSLQPHWFSTIFAAYTAAGAAQAGLAAAILLALGLRRAGALRGILREEHLHDLGKLLFAFALIWVYLWYCQYMLIWYADLPEETSFYIARSAGGWGSLGKLNLALNWLLPFLALLPRAARRSGAVLARISAVVLLGHALDLYILVGPPVLGERPLLGPWELAPVAGALCLFLLAALRGLARASLVPARDPYLAESLGYHA